MSFYGNLTTTAGRLLAKFAQGVVEIGRPVSVPGSNAWDPPVISTSWTRVNASVKGVSQKYVDGVNIVSSDLEVLTQTPVAFNETAGDQMRIDGHVVAVLSVQGIPAAGDAVVTRLIVRG
jgi:hypothetical protein